ncbi:MAG TPA: prephenate dehydrogenase [Pseudonocardiaceae bacterium]|nr:prephenate dehydrogenase [Pseudonocardiaceae bacterium]
MRDVCVLGLGLIGGSVLRAAVAGGRRAWGASASETDTERAAADGFTTYPSVADALRAAEEADALIVIAVPLPAVDDVLAQIAAHAPNCLITDVVSVKRPVADAVDRILPGARYVGGHPMAGTAESGWPAGSAGLLRGAAWVVGIEEETRAEDWLEVAELALACGAEVVPAGPDEHDAAVARISHLPHLLAAVLASVGADGGPLALSLAAGSFTDGTRVAGSRPELVRAMCEGNRVALLAAVDDALGRLGAARGSLASTGSLAVTINGGHQARTRLLEQHAAERERIQVDLGEPDALDTLLAYGSGGGRVVALEAKTVTVEAAEIADGER